MEVELHVEQKKKARQECRIVVGAETDHSDQEVKEINKINGQLKCTGTEGLPGTIKITAQIKCSASNTKFSDNS